MSGSDVPKEATASSSSVPTISIRTLLSGEDATAFRTLNEEWIARYFTLETRDIETLGDPETTIMRKGGSIVMMYADTLPIGCAALIPMGDGVYELSKMAVSPQFRGQGLGRRLILHAIAEVRRLGATSLFLGSNTRLTAAVRLYESVGFQHVSPDSLPPNPYSRANVFMQMKL